MVTISFVASGGSAVIVGSIAYGTNFSDNRYGQQTIISGDGIPVTYDVSPKNIVRGEIYIKFVEYVNGEELRLWIRTKAVYHLNSFQIVVPDNVDLGMGKGVDIAVAWFPQEDDKGVFEYVAPGHYNIKFPFMFVR
jgi:hypothetical protein